MLHLAGDSIGSQNMHRQLHGSCPHPPGGKPWPHPGPVRLLSALLQEQPPLAPPSPQPSATANPAGPWTLTLLVGKSHPQPRKKDMHHHYARVVTAVVQQGQQLSSTTTLGSLAASHQTCSHAKRGTADSTLQLLIHSTAAALAAAHQLTTGGYVQVGTHRVPVRWSTAPRPPGAVKVLVDRAPPELARHGLTASLLYLAGYTQGSITVLEEHLGHSSITGDAALLAPCSDTVVAWVVPPAADPLLLSLPDTFVVPDSPCKLARIYVEGRTAGQPWLWQAEQEAQLSARQSAAALQQQLRLFLGGTQPPPEQRQQQQRRPQDQQRQQRQQQEEANDAEMAEATATAEDTDMQDVEQPQRASTLPRDPFQQQQPPASEPPQQGQQQQQRQRHRQPTPRDPPAQQRQARPEPACPAEGRQLRSSSSAARAFEQWASTSELAQTFMLLVEQVLEEGEPTTPPHTPQQLRRSFWEAHQRQLATAQPPTDAEVKCWLRSHMGIAPASYDDDDDSSDVEDEVAAAPSALPARPARLGRHSSATTSSGVKVLRRSTRSRQPPADLTLCSPAAFGQLSRAQDVGRSQGGRSQPGLGPCTPSPANGGAATRRRPKGRGRG